MKNREGLLEAEKQEIGEKELNKQRRASEQEDEPFRQFADHDVLRGFADGQGCRKKEAGQQSDDAKIDIPQHARADQRDLLAERKIRARQQPFAEPD